jgi:DNA-binding LytR/AlgR family response regulator
MRVVIIEDEPLAADRLGYLMKEYDPSVEIIACLGSVEEAVEYFRTRPHPDLLLVDIELGDGVSFSIFSQVRIDCPVIFTTAYDQYAIEAFRLFSIDYLLKPVTGEGLARAMQKLRSLSSGFGGFTPGLTDAIRNLHHHSGRAYRSRFLVRTGSRMCFVEAAQVAYFLSEGKSVFLVSRDGSRYPLDITLEKLQEELDPREFFRLNRGIICSIHAIREIKTYFNSRLKISLHAGGQSDEAIVSRERVTAFKAWADA